MKRIVLSIVVFLVLLCGIAVAEGTIIVEWGECGASGSNVKWTLDSEGTLTISGEGKMYDYSNPDNVPWYSKRASIKTAVIDAGVTRIGRYAFYNCSSLSSVTIPEGVTSIGNYAFRGCSSLSSIDLTAGVTSIGIGAFYNCSSLDMIYVDSLEGWLNISFSDSYATPLYYGGKLYIADELATNLVLPEGTIQINDFAFWGCSSLNSIDLTAGVTSIGRSAFYDCSSLNMIYVDSLDGWLNISFSDSFATPLCYGGKLYIADELVTDLVLPEGTIQINDYAFYGCSSLRSITIPEGVTSIGNYAFYNCSKLGSITIPEGVTSIGSSAFRGCSSLSSITIPEGVTSIGGGTFSGCSSLSSITIPEGVTSIGGGTFSGCSSLSSITIPDGVTSIGNSAFYGCYSLSRIEIPEGVTSIGGGTFSGCSSLSSITIPEGVTSIGDSAFSGCSSLSSITIPEGVTSIGDSAFHNCSSLSSISIPDGVTSIGKYAFEDCSSLSSITIPEGVTSIGDSAFHNCSSLSSIDLPTSLNRIGNYAFTWCSSLKKVSVDTLEGWLNISFASSDANPLQYGEELYIAGKLVTDLVLPEGVTKIGDYAFCGCDSLRSITIPEGVTSIGYSAFAWCSSLSSITIPDSVTSIGDSAFRDCSSLKKVYADSLEGWLNIAFLSSSANPLNNGGELYIAGKLATDLVLPEGVISIGSSAFYHCSSLRSITIPDGVTSIGNYAFSGCISLSSIDLPSNLTSIGQGAFNDCSSLRSITIPASVTSIGKYTFSGCSSLSSITIPEGVTSIGDYAFRYCSSLRKVMFLGNDMPTLGSNVFSTSPTIYCYEFSDVDFWAADHGYSCVYIDNMDLNTPISITLPQDMRIEMGENRTISAGLFPQTAKAEIVWQSSDPSVVSVENGVLTAHAIGEATITASCDELSDQMNITVYASVESFELSEMELWVISKQSAQLEICDIEPVGATASFIWESSDTSVLTVSGGTISALKPGDATVTVTSDNGVERSCLVHVCYPVTAIALEQSEYLLEVGDDAQITANVTTRDQSYVNRLVTFTSSNEAVATVDASGSIHAVSPGTATISVAAASGVTATCNVTVANCRHTPVTDPAVPATHVTTGLTEGSHCSVCGEVLTAQQIVPVVEVSEIIALPAELKTIEAEAFAGDTFVCAVLPEGCRAIEAGAFRNCAQLRFVEVPASVTSIDGSAFDGCSDLIIVTVSGSEAEDFAQTHNITCVTR